MSRTLFRGGTIVSMDPTVGDIGCGDLLVEGDRIAAIGPGLCATGAQEIDAAGCILIPGLVNAHMHTWQTALRGVTGDWTMVAYFRSMHAGLATRFTPEDIYIATLAGGLNQINCGTTTLVDWCHNNPTPQHTDRAIDGLLESGIRAVFMHGSPKPDPAPGQRHFSEIPHPRSEIERLLKTRFCGSQKLVTLGMAILGPHFSTYEVARHDFGLARELGLVASMHCGGPAAVSADGWERLADGGLLGDNNNIVHGTSLSDAQLAMMIGLGVTFSLAPETEMTQGHGHPITGRLRRLGAAPSLGVDLESAISGDMFTVARMALGAQRAADNAESKNTSGQLPASSTISCREALEWITIRGAEALKLEKSIGSLSVGKQADIVMVRATDLNMWPVHDPVVSLVMQTSLANIDTVMVAGSVKKRAGRMQYEGMSRAKDLLAVSGRRIMGQLQLH